MSVDSVWREIDATWGLLTADEVQSVLGLAQADTADAARRAARVFSRSDEQTCSGIPDSRRIGTCQTRNCLPG